MQNRIGNFNPPLDPAYIYRHQIHQYPPQNPPIYPTYHPPHAPQFPPSNPSITHQTQQYPPQNPPIYSHGGRSEYEQRLRDEVIYLHSLWRRGPPSNPHLQNPHLRPLPTTHFKKKHKFNKPQVTSDKEWPIEPKPTSQETGWAEFKPRPAPNTRPASAEEQARMLALKVQLKGLDSCIGLFKGKNNSDEEDDDDDDDDEEDDYADDCDEEFEYLMNVFEGDNELKSYYEKCWDNGEFYCLVCGVIGNKLGRKYKDCVALVQHSVSISRTKKKKAHRAYGYVVCKVLGWDINRLPSLTLSNGKASSVPSLEKSNEVQGGEEVRNNADGHGSEDNPNCTKVEECSVKTGECILEPKDIDAVVNKDNVSSMDEACNGNKLLHSEVSRSEDNPNCIEVEGCSVKTGECILEPKDSDAVVNKDNVSSMDEACNGNELLRSESRGGSNSDRFEEDNRNRLKTDTVGTTCEDARAEQKNNSESVEVEAVNEMAEGCSACVN